MLDTYGSYLNNEAIAKLTTSLTEIIIAHQYTLYSFRNKQFHNTIN
jgi:hypothetical protein